MTIPAQLWVYRARAERVVDGDTIDTTIDAGFRSHRIERLRLLGVNTPELKGSTRPAGVAAADFVTLWLSIARAVPDEWPLLVQTSKSDVFGRYLGMVWRTVDGACLNGDILESGHGVPYV